MPYLLLWLSRVAADSKTSRSLCRHSGAVFFINNNTICSLFYLFCLFVYLVASINKLELKPMYSVSFCIFGVQQYMRTTAISNNLVLILTTRGPMPSQFKFLPANLNVQAGRNSAVLF